MTGTVGILAYGSVIDDPGDEIAPLIVGTTRDLMTPFGIELARASDTRGGAPTLVPMDSGGMSAPAALLQLRTDLKTAKDLLYRREIRKIGTGRTYSDPSPDDTKRMRIVTLQEFGGVAHAIYAAFPANIVPLSAAELARRAIESVAKADVGKDGVSYLIDAIRNGTKTPLMDAYQQEVLEQTGCLDLASALASIKRRP